MILGNEGFQAPACYFMIAEANEYSNTGVDHGKSRQKFYQYSRLLN